MRSGIAPFHDGREDALQHQLVNMYYETTPLGPSKDARYTRPGLREREEVGLGPVRGVFDWDGHHYVVSGVEVFRDGVFIDLIDPFGPVYVAMSYEQCVLTAGGNAFLVTDELTYINGNIPPVLAVVFMAGRFVFSQRDSDVMWFSDLNQAEVVDDLSFFSAEAEADIIQALATIGDQLVAFGTTTTEFFYAAEDIDAPFQRSQGRKYDVGSLTEFGVAHTDNALWFIGSDGRVHRTAAVPQQVSTPFIENEIQQLRDVNVVGRGVDALRLHSYEFSGHSWLLLTIADKWTYVYDVGQNRWYSWRTWGRPHMRIFAIYGKYVADDGGGKVLEFVEGLRTDVGDPIERLFTSYIPISSGVQRVFNLTLHCTRGTGNLPGPDGRFPVVEMSYSDRETGDWSQWTTAPLGPVGDRRNRATWDSLGSFQAPGMMFKFRTSEPVDFTAFDVVINEARP